MARNEGPASFRGIRNTGTPAGCGRRARVLGTAALCALLALVLPARSSGAQTSEIQVGQPATVPLPSGARVEVYGGTGYVLLKKATSDQVVVSVVKSKLAADVPVTMVKTPEGITICAIYAARDPKKPHECVPGGKGRIYDGNPEKLAEIGITVELPDGMAAPCEHRRRGGALQHRDRRRGAVLRPWQGDGERRGRRQRQGQRRTPRQHPGEPGPRHAAQGCASQLARRRSRARH